MARGVRVNGKRLRDLRDAKMLSQTRLGELAGVATPTVSRIENGHLATLDTLEKIARVLGVGADWLLARSAVDVLLENGSESQPEAIDLSDSAGAAYMDRVEGGAVEEVLEDRDKYFDYLPKYLAEPDPEGDGGWLIQAYERDLGQGLAALARRDREEGTEEIRRVLRRLREEFME